MEEHLHPLKKWRSEQGLILEAAGLRLKLSASYLSKIENGLVLPNQEDMKTIRDVTGIEPNEFYRFMWGDMATESPGPPPI